MRYPRGPLRYYLALLIELIGLRSPRFTIRLDGGAPQVRPGILVAVANTRSYGGGIPICPNADPRDGLFDVTHVAPIGRLRLIRLFPALLRSRHAEYAEVSMLRAAEVEISAPGLVAIADGERVGEGSVRLRMLPGSLRVFVPRRSAGTAPEKITKR